MAVTTEQGGLLASSGLRSGLLINIQQCTKQLSAMTNYPQ